MRYLIQQVVNISLRIVGYKNAVVGAAIVNGTIFDDVTQPTPAFHDSKKLLCIHVAENYTLEQSVHQLRHFYFVPPHRWR